MQNKGGDTRAKAALNGKKVGRPKTRALIVQKADSAIATTVLGMDGPPNHKRKCDCSVCAGRLKEKCECRTLDDAEKTKLECVWCRTREDHKICHCEVCGWWQPLIGTDKRLRFEVRRYLTDRRDGKPIQPVTHEDEKPTEINVNIRRIGA